MHPPINAYTDDALGEHDAVAIAELIRRRELSRVEVVTAAVSRAERLEPQLRAIAYAGYDVALDRPVDPEALLSGVPTFIKDNTDVAGQPTNHGTAAFLARPARHDSPVTEQVLGTGLVSLGKSRLPEFGFSAATEYRFDEPVHNPWDLGRSPGASSGGAAALVAAGVVPIAHANDGGGSIRIPAGCCGLIGLKPTRGRFADGPQARILPINIVAEGVLTRTVRDTAAYVAAAEQLRPSRRLAPVGHVREPGRARLRIGLVVDSPAGARTDAQTRAAVERTAVLLESMGHIVTPSTIPIDDHFVDDFVMYWGLLAFLVSRTGRMALDRDFDQNRLDGLTLGLRAHFQRQARHAPAMIARLRRSRRSYADAFAQTDLILSPVLAHEPPEIGWLHPQQPFDRLLRRLIDYVAFTPINNISGAPALSMPTGRSQTGVPIGVHFSAPHGGERTLLQLAYELEQAVAG